MEHYTPGEENKEGGVRNWKFQGTKQREVKCSAIGNYYYDREKEMLLLLGGFEFYFMNPGLYLWPSEISAKITVLNSPCTMKCFLRPSVPVRVESVISCKSGDTEISGCSTNKYCTLCSWGLTNISFSLRAVKLQASAFKLHDSFWDFSESK